MIRHYRESDLETVALLFTDAVHHLAGHAYAADALAAWAPRPPDLAYWSARLALLRTLVMEVDARPVGFISYECNGHIDLLFTHPSHARSGVASALYREAESELARAGVAELFTEASVVARPFFERWGFQVVEEQQVQRRGLALQRYVMRKLLGARGHKRKPPAPESPR